MVPQTFYDNIRVWSHLQHRGDDLAMSHDLGLKHLVPLEELHLGLQVGEVGPLVLSHLLHPLGHPLLGLASVQARQHLYNSTQC